MKRLLSFVLALCLVMSLGITAFAEESERTPITRVEINIPDVAVGDAITTDGVSVSVGNVTNKLWRKMPDWSSNATGNFEQNEMYCLEIIVLAPEGQYFAEPEFVFNGGEDFGTVYADESTLNIMYYVDFRVQETTYAELTGLPEKIAVGAATAPDVTMTYGNVEITGVQWVDEEKKAVTAFENGKGYYLEVALEPAQGYCFGEYMDLYAGHHSVQAELAEDEASAKAYFYYTLKPLIEKVELTVSGVELGKNVDDVKVTVPTDAKYTCENVVVSNTITWEDAAGTKFEDKNRYQMEFYLSPAAGYDFSEDLEVVVDGEENDNWHSGVTYTYVYKNYSFLTKIDKVEMTLTEPVIGGNVADAVLKAPEGAKYEVSYYWYDIVTGEQVTDGKFQDKHKYELSFDLYAAQDYEFAVDASITINGKEPESSWVEAYNPSYGWGWNTWSFMTAIDKIEFPAFPTAKVGDSKILEIQTPAGANYTLMAEWQPMNDDGNADTLQDDNVYMLVYYAQANDGYEITDDTLVLVGGKQYKGVTERSDFDVVVGKTYSFGYTAIDKVELTVTLPADGAKPGDATIPEGAKYELNYTDWVTNTTGDVRDEDTDSFKTFQYGNYYYLTVSVNAAEGYVFDDSTAFYINGQKVEAELNYNLGTSAVVAFNMGKLEAPTPTPVPDSSNPQTGDEAPIAAMVILLVLAAAGMAVALMSKKKLVK